MTWPRSPACFPELNENLCPNLHMKIYSSFAAQDGNPPKYLSSGEWVNWGTSMSWGATGWLTGTDRWGDLKPTTQNEGSWTQKATNHVSPSTWVSGKDNMVELRTDQWGLGTTGEEGNETVLCFACGGDYMIICTYQISENCSLKRVNSALCKLRINFKTCYERVLLGRKFPDLGLQRPQCLSNFFTVPLDQKTDPSTSER